jgi:hypothetical protein
MSDITEFATPRYDFSFLSKGRLRAYNRMVEEFERLQDAQDDGIELSDDTLDMLAAAGVPQQDSRDINR